jgi:LAO/AO transport system kinase
VIDRGAGAAASVDIVERATRGESAAVARMLTEIEWGTDVALSLVAEIWRLDPPESRVIGITGAAGVGKSSLVSRLLAEYSVEPQRPAVLAIDPSSERTGGSFLGDRVRMAELAPTAFLRSLPNRAIAGGLAPAAAISIAILARCGFDPVIVETVGIGQSEVAVSQVAQTTVTCLAPGLGDRIQAAKAGLMETADIFAVTKSDLPSARVTVDHVRAMVNLGARAPGTWRRPVCAVSARTGDGVAELVASVAEHQDWCRRPDRFEPRSRSLATQCVLWASDLLARRAVEQARSQDALGIASADVASGRLDPIAASRRIAAP